MDNCSLHGKTALVIDADSYNGIAVVEELLKLGARVIMACLDMFRAERVAFHIVERTGTKQLAIQYVDLRSLDSINDFISRIEAEEQRLDILINNADGDSFSYPSCNVSQEFTLGVDQDGRFVVIMKLLHLLKKSAPSRIINASIEHNPLKQKYQRLSSSMKGTLSGNCVYNGSTDEKQTWNYKTFSEQLEHDLCGTGVTSLYLELKWNIIDSGEARLSNFLFLNRFSPLSARDSRIRTIINCAVDPNPEKFISSSSDEETTSDKSGKGRTIAKGLFDSFKKFVKKDSAKSLLLEI